MGSEGEEQQTPLMGSFNDPEMPVKRTGTLWTAIAHVITGVIGAGVLSLAWSTAQLGWVAGPLTMVVFAAITILSTNLLCDCYKFPDPKCGPERNKSYVEAVKLYLGETRRRISVVFLHESLYGCGIAYTITAATSVRNLVGLHSSYNHGVIGSGILSLAWSVAQLGWIAGPASPLGFAIPTYISAFLVSDCYRYPDPVRGTRNPSYKDAVRVILVYWVVQVGNSSGYVLCFSLSLYGVCIAYVITTSLSLRAIQQSNCYHKEGHEANCTFGDTIYMVIFGGVQLIVSQIPDFHNMAWLSVIAAIMSFSYAFIGLGLGVAKVIENGTIKGSIGGVPEATVAEKLWLIFQALGDIAFAYPYSIILFEIQDTLKSPPPENQTMKKASVAAIFITTFFYLCCGCFGYAAFGSDTPGNLLTGFGFYEPYWLIDFANACVILHLVGGYQVYSQPLFAYGERWVSEKFPNSRFVNNSYAIKLPFLPAFQLSLLRLCFRTVYVVSTTAIAVVFPYFNQVLGVLGALNFWPLAIYFPVEMYFVQRKIEAWTTKWVVLQTFSIVCLVVSILGLIGSIEGLISAKFG